MTDFDDETLSPECELWPSIATHILSDYFDAGNELFHCSGCIDGQWKFVASELFLSCHLTSESALLLVRHARLWDAELLVRSVLEGSIRLLYMCRGSELSRLNRCQEYWIDVPEIGRLKKHDRVKAILEHAADPNAEEHRPFRDLLLEESEAQAIRDRYPRAARKQLDHKWSFSELVKALCDSSVQMESLRTLMYGYGLSSHYIHQDGDAIGTIWDRRQRSPQRQRAVEEAHIARLTSDILGYAGLRTHSLRLRFGADPRVPEQAKDRFDALLQTMAEAYERFMKVEYGTNS